MKITKIRINGQKPTETQLKLIADDIENHMASIGFKAEAELTSGTALKVGFNKCQFHVDIEKRGYNTRHSFGTAKRTRIPSWDQRVEFNDALNAILTTHGVSARIVSGPFVIREGERVYTEQDWLAQTPSYILENIARGFYVETGDYKADLKKARA